MTRQSVQHRRNQIAQQTHTGKHKEQEVEKRCMNQVQYNELRRQEKNKKQKSRKLKKQRSRQAKTPSEGSPLFGGDHRQK